jgi:hypothetical protein
MAVLHASPQTPEIAATPRFAGDGKATGRGERVCPECGQSFQAAQWRQFFCSPDHKSAFHNRQTVRGRVLTPLAMAARQTRGGSRGDKATGRAARADADFLMQRWTDEDRAAGRMPMVEYVALRRSLGFERT